MQKNCKKKNYEIFSYYNKGAIELQEEKLLKSGTAAKYLKVTQKTLFKWYENGTLIPVKVADNGYKYYSQKQLYIFRQEHPNFYPDTQNLYLGAKSTSTTLQTATNSQKLQPKSSKTPSENSER